MNAGPFRDRYDGGKRLAKHVVSRIHGPDVLVLGLPRGGVPVAFEVAQALNAELDVFLVRKLGAPGQEELALGAIASGGIRVVNRPLLNEVQLDPKLLGQIAEREERELRRQEKIYREGRPALRIAGRTVALVDDGLATGASMMAAAEALRLHGPKRVIAAVPVAARETCDQVRTIVEIICPFTPEPFVSVGTWYADFSQTSDQEVRRLLEMADRPKRDS